MKLFILSILLLVYTITLAQPNSQWKNYTDYGTVYNAVKHNQTIWGATHGGIIKIDMQTKEQFCYNRANANLPYNDVRSLDVDTNGNVWFVTYSQWGGVSKFDGWAVNNYTEDNSPIKNGTATAVGASRNNNIWVACGSDSLFMFDGSIWTNYQIPWDTIYNKSYIKKIVFDSENNIWCLTDYALIKYDGVSWKLYNGNDISTTVGWISWFRNIAVGNDSSVWVTSDKAVMEYRNYQWHYYQDTFINNCSNHAIAIDDNNVKWVEGTRRDLPPHTNENWLIRISDTSITAIGKNEGFSPYASVFSIIADSNKIWIPSDSLYVVENNTIDKYPPNLMLGWYGVRATIITKDNRTFVFDSGGGKMKEIRNWKVDTLPYYIPNVYRNSVHAESSDGALWIATRNKLVRIKNDSVSNLDYPNLYNYYLGLEIDNTDLIWVFPWAPGPSELGKVYTYNGQNWSTFYLPDTTLRISCIKCDKLGNMWFGTYSKSMYKYYNGNWTHYNNSWVLQNGSISKIILGNNNDVWFASSNNGLIHKSSTDVWRTYNSMNSGLVSDTISDLAIDKNGKLYIGTNMGISILDGNSWDTLTVRNSRLPDRYIKSLAIDTLGNLWIGTAYGGLAVYKQNGLVLSFPSKAVNSKSKSLVFPNPSNGEFVLQTDGQEISEISVYDIQGRLVKQLNSFKAKSDLININLRGLKKGVYLLLIKSDGGFYSQKIIIQ